jgi:hypothetical protein
MVAANAAETLKAFLGGCLDLPEVKV